MKIRNYFILFLAVASVALASEKWINYSYPFPIKSSIPFGDGVLLATDGGVRYRSPQGDDLYTSSDGLETSGIHALTSSDRGVFAVSEDGVIATMDGHGRWTVISRAYAGSNIHVIPDMVRIAGSTIVIAFSDRLAFFDLNSVSSIISIDKISNVSLLNPITAMEVKGDSLYVATSGSLFVRKMNWEHMMDDFRLSDPGSWSLVKNESVIRSIVWKGKELKTYPAPGVCLWDDDKIKLSVFEDSTDLIVDGKVLKDEHLYSTTPIVKKDTLYRLGRIDSIRVDTIGYAIKNLVKWAAPLSSGGAMLVGENGIFYYDGSKVKDLTEYGKFRLKGAYELQMMPHGGVIAASVEGDFAFNAGPEWSGTMDAWVDGPTKVGNSSDASAHGLRELSVLADGTVFYHIWGLGFFLYSDWGQNRFYSGYTSDEPCLDVYYGSIHSPYAVGTTRAPDNSGFLATVVDSLGYGLIYVKSNGEMTCASRVGSTNLSGPIAAKYDEDTREWVVFVGTRKSDGKASDGGLDVLRFAAPNTTGGYITDVKVESYYGYSTTPVDMVFDAKSEYLWIVTTSALEYWDEDMKPEKDSLKIPFATNGLTGAEYTSIDVDVRGNLWVGTSGQGIYRLTPQNLNPDTLQVKHFTARNGLLNDDVMDVVVDSVLGAVWTAHPNGVTSYRRSDLRSAAGNMTDDAKLDVKVYPNPFRMHEQSFVVFDNVAEDAFISIYNAGGNLVRSLHGDALHGGRAEWDGKDKRGKEVTPGVYHYVVKTSSKAKKGKLIVVR